MERLVGVDAAETVWNSPLPRLHLPGYQICRELGRGGMATVYLAVQHSLQRPVALKVLHHPPEEPDRPLLEAVILGQLAHPRVVKLFDAGSCAFGNYLTLEYLPGGTLRRRLKQLSRPLTPKAALALVGDLATALHYVHHRGFVHRDLKPRNVLFTADDEAVLGDFGSAIPLGRDVSLPAKGVERSWGSPRYVSPEQWQRRCVDGRADLYALGVILFELLTRRPPFMGAHPRELALQHVKAPIPRLPRALVHLQPLIDGLLAKDPADRFDAATCLAATHKLAQGGHSPGPWYRRRH